MFPRLQLWVFLKTSALCLGPFYQSVNPTSHSRIYRIASILKTYWLWIPILHYRKCLKIIQQYLNLREATVVNFLQKHQWLTSCWKKKCYLSINSLPHFFKQTAPQIRSTVIFRHVNYVIFRHVNFVIGCANFQQAW